MNKATRRLRLEQSACLITGATVFWAAWLMQSIFPDRCAGQIRTTQRRLSDLAVSRIALMPFLMGRLESPSSPITKPLSRPITEIEINIQDLPQNANQAMTRMVNDVLKLRVELRLVSPVRVADVYQALLTDTAFDTPRRRAVKLGEILRVPIVMVGTVWQYREKGAFTEIPGSPATIGFALYLADVETGERFWRGTFEETQKVLTDDLLGGLKQIDIGFRRLHGSNSD